MPLEYGSFTDTTRTQRGSIRLTDRSVKGLVAPERGNKVYYDDRIKGLGLRVTAAGKRAFVLNYRIKGRERRMTIGGYPEWTVLAARERAEEMRRDIDSGNDPLEKREATLKAPTMIDLFERYLKDHLPSKSTSSQIGDMAMWDKKILPTLGRKKLEDVTFTDCDALHRKLSKTAPVQANRLVSLLRKSFNLAIRWGWIEKNPAIGIQYNPENKRERYLSRAELNRLLTAFDQHPERTSYNLIRFLLLTGCRRGEAFNATWDQFNTDLTVWTKPAATTKQRRLHRVPVSSSVTDLLQRRKLADRSEYVFASKFGKPMTDVKKAWVSLCKSAGLENIRLHDLRHTFASLLVSQGQSLPVIGAMLGHTQTQTTARYAHLFDDSLVSAAELVSSAINDVN